MEDDPIARGAAEPELTLQLTSPHAKLECDPPLWSKARMRPASRIEFGSQELIVWGDTWYSSQLFCLINELVYERFLPLLKRELVAYLCQHMASTWQNIISFRL